MTIVIPIPSALVWFKTPLFDTITNTANLWKNSDIAVFGKKQRQESYIAALIFQGYSIEATTKGLIGQVIGATS
jgi:hypothetical protein